VRGAAAAAEAAAAADDSTGGGGGICSDGGMCIPSMGCLSERMACGVGTPLPERFGGGAPRGLAAAHPEPPSSMFPISRSWMLRAGGGDAALGRLFVLPMVTVANRAPSSFGLPPLGGDSPAAPNVYTGTPAGCGDGDAMSDADEESGEPRRCSRRVRRDMA